MRAGKPTTGIATHEAAVNLCQARRRRLRVACHGQSFRLQPKERRPQDRERCPRPLRTAANRRWHAPRSRGQMGRGHEPKRLFERPRIAVVGGGVGGLLEELGRCGRLIAVERDAAEDDQPPGGERMIEPVLDQQAAVEKRCRLIRLALRPVGNAQRDVDP